MKTNSGFTFIETVLAVLIIGIGIFGVLNLFQGTVSNAFTTDRVVQATQLARERLERMVFDKKMFGYDYITSANYPAIESFTGVYSPFTRTVAIQNVYDWDLDRTAASNTGYRKITVTVSWPDNQRIAIQSLVTQWNE